MLQSCSRLCMLTMHISDRLFFGCGDRLTSRNKDGSEMGVKWVNQIQDFQAD